MENLYAVVFEAKGRKAVFYASRWMGIAHIKDQMQRVGAWEEDAYTVELIDNVKHKLENTDDHSLLEEGHLHLKLVGGCTWAWLR